MGDDTSKQTYSAKPCADPECDYKDRVHYHEIGGNDFLVKTPGDDVPLKDHSPTYGEWIVDIDDDDQVSITIMHLKGEPGEDPPEVEETDSIVAETFNTAMPPEAALSLADAIRDKALEAMDGDLSD